MATIEITKAEAKEAGVFKSEMYENLKEAREATGYKVVVKDTKRKADTMKGLTCFFIHIFLLGNRLCIICPYNIVHFILH